MEVPRPCAEAWEAMTPTAHGRHCAACQHTVTDFTHKTDAEVLALLRQAAGRRVCGRFRADQLQRPLLVPQSASRWQTRLLAASTLLGLRTLGAEATQAQAVQVQHPGPPAPVAPASINPDKVSGEASISPIRYLQISGRVLDAVTGEPLPGATVLVKDTRVGAATGADGSFEFNAPSGKGMLLISSVGFKPRVLAISAITSPIQIALQQDDTRLLGEVIIIPVPRPWYSPRTWWYTLRSVPHRVANIWR
ncbi:hypothetical protein ASU33_00495 [Solirubrum puertoriconensis]|uniref:TonB-dependent receptor plug domain-containing protein n=1 Tax=Solirubrum puertoriconensis TaxID=1751427 RepID=A0A9X0L2Y0_SOLP1|nr:hypothetical protein ASU33_00495 [Solirubrum puertoriconensis]